MTVFTINMQTLSPLHIGDGGELRQDFDFVIHKERTYRLDEDAVLRAKEDALRPGRDGRYPPPGRLLDKDDFQNPELFRYVLRGALRSGKTYASLKSCIKDIHDQPYIPGSSLKGAIRTALAWMGWDERINGISKRDFDSRKRPKHAGDELERKLFGKDPNHDLLRALLVSDLFGPQKPGEGIIVANAQVLTKKSAASPVELEAVKGDVAFTGSLTIDDTIFSPEAEKQLHLGNRRHWLEELVPRIKSHSKARISELVNWFEHADGCEQIAGFYRQLEGAMLGDNQALIQLGWGSGWDGKTFWTHLQQDAHLFEWLVRDFRMQRAGRGSPRQPGDPFPRSKRAAMRIGDRVAKPAAPFGWILMEVNPA